MEKKLAIKGHSTRGNEVIELLGMMGGKNNCNSTGDNLGLCYLIDDETDIVRQSVGYVDYEDGGLNIFTLEEFLEKYPFKIGDKVIDKADGCPGIVIEMKWDESVSDMKYLVAFGDGIDFGWFVNDSIEFYKKNENLEETQSKRDIDKSEFIIKHMMLPNKIDDKLEYEIIDGYEFDKVDNNKIILKPIKFKYPTSYDECCQYLGCDDKLSVGKLIPFQQLFNARNAYWKIAGKEMGLGKPWEPDWNEETDKFTISNKCNKIYLNNTAWYAEVLSFPTAEMRDAFYENFKELIEKCKELL